MVVESSSIHRDRRKAATDKQSKKGSTNQNHQNPSTIQRRNKVRKPFLPKQGGDKLLTKTSPSSKSGKRRKERNENDCSGPEANSMSSFEQNALSETQLGIRRMIRNACLLVEECPEHEKQTFNCNGEPLDSCETFVNDETECKDNSFTAVFNDSSFGEVNDSFASYEYTQSEIPIIERKKERIKNNIKCRRKDRGTNNNNCLNEAELLEKAFRATKKQLQMTKAAKSCLKTKVSTLEDYYRELCRREDEIKYTYGELKNKLSFKY